MLKNLTIGTILAATLALPLACAYGSAMSRLGSIFRRRLRDLMLGRHVTQEAVAKALDVDRARISKILKSDTEAGTVKLNRLEVVAAFFDVPVADLLRGSEDAPVALRPLEGQLIELFRRLPATQQENLFQWLDFVFAQEISVERERKQLRILRQSLARQIDVPRPRR